MSNAVGLVSRIHVSSQHEYWWILNVNVVFRMEFFNLKAVASDWLFQSIQFKLLVYWHHITDFMQKMSFFLVFWNDLYHLKSRWRNSDVLVYQGPLQIATFWEWLAIYFHYGVYQAASCSCWYSTSTAAIRSRSCELADSPKTARSNAAIPQLSWTNPPGSWRSVWKIKMEKNGGTQLFWGGLPKVVFFFMWNHICQKRYVCNHFIRWMIPSRSPPLKNFATFSIDVFVGFFRQVSIGQSDIFCVANTTSKLLHATDLHKFWD